MANALHLALAYARFHAGQTTALVLAVALIAFVPLATRMVLGASEAALGARAAATPLLVGARGGATELVLNALYFTPSAPQTIGQDAADAIWDSGLALPIPLHVRYRAGGLPVVGTTLDYFDFRRLTLAQGRPFGVLGEAVLGAEAARRLGLGPGDTLVTDPETLFDLTGAYPLELRIVGRLARADSPDDAAVFVDARTAWIIAGIGHGHADVAAETGAAPRASPAIEQFTRITPETIGSFHFHGDARRYPLSAVLAVPADARAEAVLRGRYLAPEAALQSVRPAEVVDSLLGTLLRIGRLLDATALLAGLAAAVAIAVAVYLSLQLRRAEIETMFHLGARRATMARMLAAQMGLILGAGLIVAGLLLVPLWLWAPALALRLVAAGP